MKTSSERLAEACDLLNTLRTDAYMALNGDWNIAEYATDESKEGFECQIRLIEDFFDKIDYKYEEHEIEENEIDESIQEIINSYKK